MDISYEFPYNIICATSWTMKIYDKPKIKNKLLEKEDSKVEEELEKVQKEPITVAQ